MAVDLAQFRVSRASSLHVGGTVEGLSDTACGPEWWTPDYATRRLTGSSWATERKAKLISCLGEGGSPGRSLYFRRFRCRYSNAEGDGAVILTTTGRDTYEIEPSR